MRARVPADAARPRGLLLATVCAWASACAPAETPSVARSQSLARRADRLYLAATDADAVLTWTTTPLAVLETTPVGPAPTQLTLGPDALVVTHARTGSVAVLRLDGSAPGWVSTPCRRTQAVVTDDDRAWVTCPDEDLLLGLDLTRLELSHVAGTPRRPTTLARRGRALLLGTAGEGALHLLDLDALQGGATLEGARLDRAALETTPGVAVNLLDASDASVDGFLTLHQRVEHDADRSRPPEQGGYGSVVDLKPRIEPRLVGNALGAELARFDGGPRAASLPAAVAHAPTRGLTWTLARGTDVALVVAGGPTPTPLLPEPTSGRPRLVASARLGRGPRGLVLSDDGRTAWVDVALDRAVAVLTLPADLDANTADAEAPALVPTTVVRWVTPGTGALPTRRRARPPDVLRRHRHPPDAERRREL